MSAAIRARHRTRAQNPSSIPSVEGPAPQAAPRIESRALADLKPDPKELRKHSEKQLAKLVASIKAFGFNSLLVVDETNTLIAGHARWEAAKRAGCLEAHVLVATHLNPAQRRAYRIADNRIAEDAEWNQAVLKIELAELSAPDLDFNVELTGFSTAEIDLIIDGPEEVDDRTDEDLPPLGKTAVTKPGDLWRLGAHVLLCGDARRPDAYRHLLGESKARLVVTDPPYNVPVDGHVSGLGRVTHREFAMASGEMNRPQFTEFLAVVFARLTENSLDGALHYHCMDHRHIEEMIAAGALAYDERKNVLVWVKTNAGMGSFYRSQHELIFVYKHGRAPHVNNVQLGANGRYRTNVLEYAGANTFRRGRDDELARHPTPKPVPLIADLIRDASNTGDLVLDCFAGGGTIFIAAEKTRRRAAGIEIDPLYCDLAVERWERHTGKEAVLVDTGQTFSQVAVESRERSPSTAKEPVGGEHGR